MAQIKFLKDTQITNEFSKNEQNEIARMLANGAPEEFIYRTSGMFRKEDWSGLLSLKMKAMTENKVTMELSIVDEALEDYIEKIHTLQKTFVDYYMFYIYYNDFFTFLHIFKAHRGNMAEFNKSLTDLAKKTIECNLLEDTKMNDISEIGIEVFEILNLKNPIIQYELGNAMVKLLTNMVRIGEDNIILNTEC